MPTSHPMRRWLRPGFRDNASAATDFFLESADLPIHDPVQTRQWVGRPLQAIFPVELMEIAETDREAVRAVLHVSVAGVPIGEVFFDVRVIQLPLATGESEPTVLR